MPGSLAQNDEWFDSGLASFGSRANKRKAASALIAKIPFTIARHIAAVYYPADRILYKHTATSMLHCTTTK